MNPFSPKSDELLTSPYINTAVSFMKIMRTLEMITNIRSFDLLLKFFLSAPKEMCRESKSMANINTDVRL